jgi:hypothetical protein
VGNRPFNGAELVKRFGMSNQLAETELDRIERELEVDLGRRPEIDQWEEKYYPQFDEAVRIEAAEMSKHYRVFYCLEKTIREIIDESLRQQDGAKWWDGGRVPPKLHADVKARIQREVDSGITLRSDNPIDFTTFGELGELIKANWDIFGGIFDSQRAVEKVLANLNLLRGPIAHCSPLAEDEVLRLELSLRDWFRMME